MREKPDVPITPLHLSLPSTQGSLSCTHPLTIYVRHHPFVEWTTRRWQSGWKFVPHVALTATAADRSRPGTAAAFVVRHDCVAAHPPTSPFCHPVRPPLLPPLPTPRRVHDRPPRTPPAEAREHYYYAYTRAGSQPPSGRLRMAVAAVERAQWKPINWRVLKRTRIPVPPDL